MKSLSPAGSIAAKRVLQCAAPPCGLILKVAPNLLHHALPGEGNVIGEFSPSNTLQFDALRFVSQGRKTRIDDISLFYNLLSPPLIELLDRLAGRRRCLINL